MSDPFVLLPSLDAYVAAFQALEDKGKITDKQHQMLKVHHAAPGRAVSATTLAEAVGYAGYSSANMQYGKLAHALSRELGVNLPSVQVGLLAQFVYPAQAKNDQFLWLLRERVALALEELGWVQQVSQYLYPDLALAALGSPDTNT